MNVRRCPEQAFPRADFRAFRFRERGPPAERPSKFGGRKLASTKYRGRFRGVRNATLCLRHLPAHERGLHERLRTRSRITPHLSLEHSLSCGPRATCRHTPHTTTPRRTAPDFLCSFSLESDNSQRRERSVLEQRLPRLAHRFSAEGQRLCSRTPAARSSTLLLMMLRRARPPNLCFLHLFWRFGVWRFNQGAALRWEQACERGVRCWIVSAHFPGSLSGHGHGRARARFGGGTGP